eukprot:CAMPEP_0179220048 /NCGR_PEP_ID=MMETSP0797-20121207/5387_1 /TAXON_ID=47934 /ORGANISM="Dinophysis acuminata, Strain DAEP01" /LENGTH=110 /DNA_ID=CAMNT_0020926613 /DNA_START=156 /DNA_END=485 /DNA_ORIENTATION=-
MQHGDLDGVGRRSSDNWLSVYLRDQPAMPQTRHSKQPGNAGAPLQEADRPIHPGRRGAEPGERRPARPPPRVPPGGPPAPRLYSPPLRGRGGSAGLSRGAGAPRARQPTP